MGKAKGKQYYHLAKEQGCRSRAHSLTEDITTTRCRSAVRRLIDTKGITAFDVSALVIDAVRLATMFLAPNGMFVTKVFRSQDYNVIMFCLKQLFDKVEMTKPRASRGTSAEIYIICYKAPAKIQPELLDIKHLFNVDPEKNTPKDVLDTKNAKKRTRAGYAPGVTVQEKVVLASDFIWSEAHKPREFLGSFTKISFDNPASLPIKNHEVTTDEVKYLCQDLQVLDKNRFKHILKRRACIRKALPPSSQVTPKADDHYLEEMLHEAYERYVTKKGQEVKQEYKRDKRIDPDADAETNPLLSCLDTEKPAEEQDVKAVAQSGYVHRGRKKGKGSKGGAKGGEGMKGSAGEKK
ncbi:hypothetical protein VPH35_010785 [Triticum aestivum]